MNLNTTPPGIFLRTIDSLWGGPGGKIYPQVKIVTKCARDLKFCLESVLIQNF